MANLNNFATFTEDEKTAFDKMRFDFSTVYGRNSTRYVEGVNALKVLITGGSPKVETEALKKGLDDSYRKFSAVVKSDIAGLLDLDPTLPPIQRLILSQGIPPVAAAPIVAAPAVAPKKMTAQELLKLKSEKAAATKGPNEAKVQAPVIKTRSDGTPIFPTGSFGAMFFSPDPSTSTLKQKQRSISGDAIAPSLSADLLQYDAAYTSLMSGNQDPAESAKIFENMAKMFQGVKSPEKIAEEISAYERKHEPSVDPSSTFKNFKQLPFGSIQDYEANMTMHDFVSRMNKVSTITTGASENVLTREAVGGATSVDSSVASTPRDLKDDQHPLQKKMTIQERIADIEYQLANNVMSNTKAKSLRSLMNDLKLIKDAT